MRNPDSSVAGAHRQANLSVGRSTNLGGRRSRWRDKSFNNNRLKLRLKGRARTNKSRSGRDRAAANPDLDVLIVVVVRRGRGPTAVARGHPPTALERVPIRLDVGAAFAKHRLVHVPGHDEDAERAHALRARGRRLTAIGQDLIVRVRLVHVVSGFVSHRLARKHVRGPPHLFTLAREVPFALGADALAESAAHRARLLEALVVQR